MPIEDIHDSALNECLGIVYIAIDVPPGMVAQNSVHDGVNNCAHLVPRVDLWHHLQTMTILRMIGQNKRGGGGVDDRALHMTTRKKLPGHAIFSGHF